jgi:metal-responsive CopG/Arc/MetJ family transcriptional regulator
MNQTKQIIVKMQEGLYKSFQRAVNAEHRNMSEVIRQLICTYTYAQEKDNVNQETSFSSDHSTDN